MFKYDKATVFRYLEPQVKAVLFNVKKNYPWFFRIIHPPVHQWQVIVTDTDALEETNIKFK